MSSQIKVKAVADLTRLVEIEARAGQAAVDLERAREGLSKLEIINGEAAKGSVRTSLRQVDELLSDLEEAKQQIFEELLK